MDYFDNGFKVVRIVITGGPCSGKTTALDQAAERLGDLGFTILMMPETATQLISCGISPWSCESLFSYQRWQMRLQLAKEKVYAGAAEEIARVQGKPVLILYDRGMMDNKAYSTDEEFVELLDELELTEDECLSWYDGVFHLETAAKGAVEFYTCANNSTRTETVEEAIEVDNASLHAWEDYPDRVIIDNSTDFAGKMDRLYEGIRSVLIQASEDPEDIG
ncbi:MAG: ATP-binding protein [Eubacterium sp.]|nr:ATP-binding protein [Eubacterium sp.]